MRPVQAKDIDRHQCFFLFDDEPLLNLIVAFQQEEHAQEWWHVVVDVEGGGYAVSRVSDFIPVLEGGDEDTLSQPLSAFVGQVLTPVSVVRDMSKADFNALRDEAFDTPSRTAVLLAQDEFRGVIPFGGTRSGGALDKGLLEMAGRYGDIPTERRVSNRRLSKKKPKTDEKK
jgi:hypothetical protein